ncbi:ASCH domain-containing protein [Flavobacterium anhuiense]|uniref:ASCH domain-containing protein n=1 Tax=Flavobacterium anhuiense TaxID=459526 RepID=UPI002026E1A3|nr:ASCH domain-containing protein [Flavobacterium anhuiense]URM37161.1 ASCH domain-containing protein [Flavobacterium anhuiense]
MKALSIKNPWAFLIASGIKDIENRTWRTNFRGKIQIHVSAKIAWVDFTLKQLKELESHDINLPGAGYPKEWLTVSAIIGEVEIIDCVINHSSIWAEKTPIKGYTVEGEPLFEHRPIWNWVLANAVLYEKPILNVKGKLSFWEYSQK